MASLWGELKRRNVVRVAVAYAIVSWLILQLTDVLIPILALPDWVGRLVFLILLLGFPLALFFAWAFELTPEGVKREKDVDRSKSVTHLTGRKLDFVIIGVMAIALVMFAVDKFLLSSDTDTASDSAQEITATNSQQSIAVLPFVNMSSDPEQGYFSDGLSEEILNLLAKIPDLKVIARTSSFAFKGKNVDVRSIGQTLAVNTVLEGSVRKSGDRVRITAQLIDVSSGAHLWSESYDRTMTDIFTVQDDVASAIIAALQIHVGKTPTRGRPTENPDAYALFLKGRDAINRFDARSASQFLRNAIELDQRFAEAYELLAYSLWYQAGETIKVDEAQAGIKSATERALAIDPSLVFARAMLVEANIVTYSPKELASMEIATRQSAASGESNRWAAAEILTWNLLITGYFREALSIVEQFAESDPLSPAVQSRLADALQAVGHEDEALAALTLADDLGSETAARDLFYLELEGGRDGTAIALFERSLKADKERLPTGWVGDLVAGARDPATGQAHLDRRIPQILALMPEDRTYEMSLNLIRLYLSFGFLDRYYELIDELGETSVVWNDAEYLIFRGTITRRSGFTSHPAYLRVAENYAYGAVSLWEERGPPDFCERVGGEWVCE